MKTLRVKIETIDKVKRFVDLAAKTDLDLDLVSGRYVIDAKSIMGIFSLDLSKELILNIHAEGGNELEKFLNAVDEFVVK